MTIFGLPSVFSSQGASKIAAIRPSLSQRLHISLPRPFMQYNHRCGVLSWSIRLLFTCVYVIRLKGLSSVPCLPSEDPSSQWLSLSMVSMRVVTTIFYVTSFSCSSTPQITSPFDSSLLVGLSHIRQTFESMSAKGKVHFLSLRDFRARSDVCKYLQLHLSKIRDQNDHIM
jgi:hypothetical protein